MLHCYLTPFFNYKVELIKNKCIKNAPRNWKHKSCSPIDIRTLSLVIHMVRFKKKPAEKYNSIQRGETHKTIKFGGKLNFIHPVFPFS
jgi:hypothetical protein